jgi:hypothetical protein
MDTVFQAVIPATKIDHCQYGFVELKFNNIYSAPRAGKWILPRLFD